MIAPHSRSERSRGAAALSIVLVSLLLVASLGVLWWLGYLQVPALERFRRPVEAVADAVQGGGAKSRAGKVAVPMAARPVPAYTRVTRDVFWDPEAKAFSSIWLDADVVKERGICTAEQALGRVLAVDKAQGYIFSEEDFLPRGTREGPTAGIEDDMRGLRVAVDRIQGLHGLRRNDRFDLIATRPVDMNERRRELGDVAPLATALQADLDVWETSTRILVQNGKVVEPVRVRNGVGGNRPNTVEEVFIAVHDSEVTRLTEALALGAQIQCVPRSALPGAGIQALRMHEAPSGPGVVEVISDGRRRLSFVPLDPADEPRARAIAEPTEAAMRASEAAQALPASAPPSAVRVVSDLVIPREHAPEPARRTVDPASLVTGEGKFGAQDHARRSPASTALDTGRAGGG